MPDATHDKRKRACDATKRRCRERRARVIAAYGGACACCGEQEFVFLSIDHVNGGGCAQRKERGWSSASLYTWLEKSGFPEGFQVLCHNCNFAKSHWAGGCPHGHV